MPGSPLRRANRIKAILRSVAGAARTAPPHLFFSLFHEAAFVGAVLSSLKILRVALFLNRGKDPERLRENNANVRLHRRDGAEEG